VTLEPGDTVDLSVTPDPYVTVRYAGASGDFNPIHIDSEVGAAAGLGGAILHGLCTMAWAVESAVKYLGNPGKVTKMRVRFSRPVAIGDVLTFDGTVTQIAQDRLTAEISAKNQKGEEVLKGAVVEARTT
jgi:acyl dehydratase